MSEITIGAVERAVRATTTTVLRNEQYFSDLDGVAGDGDFGASLSAGFRVVDKDFAELDKSSIGALLLKISMIITRNVGGCSGPIWGTGFMRAAMLSKEKTSVTLAELEEMLTAAIDGIQQRGGAKLGDKTLLDALIPVRDTVKEHAASGTADTAIVLSDATAAAEEAIEHTKDMVARRGRQSFTGDRSIGSLDPGIVAIATILQDLCTEFGVSRAAKAA
ncbi:MAG: dhaL [Sphingomonas bacterium]|jgi:dihydroxyacetone kinase-like protein|nr:dhaL [Sphingomonas bacterium]MDB5682356.1 dhaL [Sphingomonas bacterium]MDB5718258.1 dhaL [Sphingomonas bacterium]